MPCGSTAPSRFQKNGWSSATTSAVIVFVHCARVAPAARSDKPNKPSAIRRAFCRESTIVPLARPNEQIVAAGSARLARPGPWRRGRATAAGPAHGYSLDSEVFQGAPSSPRTRQPARCDGGSAKNRGASCYAQQRAPRRGTQEGLDDKENFRSAGRRSAVLRAVGTTPRGSDLASTPDGSDLPEPFVLTPPSSARISLATKISRDMSAKARASRSQDYEGTRGG